MVSIVFGTVVEEEGSILTQAELSAEVVFKMKTLIQFPRPLKYRYGVLHTYEVYIVVENWMQIAHNVCYSLKKLIEI